MKPPTPDRAGTLLMRVDDLDRAAAQYRSLGLRTLSRTRAMLVVELPCGVHLILFRPWGGSRACA